LYNKNAKYSLTLGGEEGFLYVSAVIKKQKKVKISLPLSLLINNSLLN